MWLDNASDIDFLFYGPYAEIIAEIAADKINTPVTIGVFGLWGAGKSTLLNIVDEKLKEQENTVVISINAWTFEGYEDAKIALMESIVKEIHNNSSFSSLKDKIKRLFKRIDFLKLASNAFGFGLSTAALATGDPGPMAMAVTRVAKDTVDFIGQAKETISEDTTVENIRSFRIEFIDILKESSTNLVIVIDDLDRCNPDRIIETLEAIKLFLSVENTAFIIAADENVIQYAINKRYQPVQNSTFDLSTEYIEKIIQLPITLPELSQKDIENYLLLLIVQNYTNKDDFKRIVEYIYKNKIIVRDSRLEINEISEICEKETITIENKEHFYEDASVIDNIREIVATTLKGNPRQAKRFLNTFVTKKKLAQMYYGDDIDARTLAKILVLHKIDPILFNKLSEWNRSFDTENVKFIEMQEQLKNGEVSEENKRWNTPQMKLWLDSEPQELGKINLQRYFYLTREQLNRSENLSNNYSEEIRSILEQIASYTRASIPSIISQIEALEPNSINVVIDIICKKFVEEKIEYDLISFIFEKLVDFQQLIIDAAKKRKKSIELGDVTYLQRMLEANNSLVSMFLKSTKKNGKINESIYKMIIGER